MSDGQAIRDGGNDADRDQICYCSACGATTERVLSARTADLRDLLRGDADISTTAGE